MIQEIAPEEFSLTYDLRAPKEGAFLFAFDGGRLCGQIDAAGRLVLPRYEETRLGAEDCTFLFSVSGRDYFSVPHTAEGLSYPFSPLRRMMAAADNTGAFAAATAYHLVQWYQQTRYCGVCAAPMSRDAHERAMRCPSCGAVVYPRINPAVVVGLIDGEKLLLTKYAPSHGQTKHYALIAGFCEVGESAEDTVRREVWEEVGLHARNIRYYGSQPWGIAGNLTLGFFAELDGDGTIHMDGEELSCAQWVSRKDVPVRDDRLSLTAEMMKAYHDGTIK